MPFQPLISDKSCQTWYAGIMKKLKKRRAGQKAGPKNKKPLPPANSQSRSIEPKHHHHTKYLYRRYAELAHAGYKPKDIAKEMGTKIRNIRIALKTPSVKKYMEELNMDWKARSQAVFEKMLKYVDDRVEAGERETKVTYKKNRDGEWIPSSMTKTKRSLTLANLLTAMKIAGLYQPVQKVDVQHKTEEDKKEMYKNLIKRVENISKRKKASAN